MKLVVFLTLLIKRFGKNTKYTIAIYIYTPTTTYHTSLVFSSLLLSAVNDWASNLNNHLTSRQQVCLQGCEVSPNTHWCGTGLNIGSLII